jgi:hypothetical protein
MERLVAYPSVDGWTRNVEDKDLVPGTVVRSVQWRQPTESGGRDVVDSFSDCVIVKVIWRDKKSNPVPAFKLDRIQDGWTKHVVLARPYAFVSSANTGCPSVLTGVEQYELPAEKLTGPCSAYRVVTR